MKDPLHTLVHVLWTKAVGTKDYVKEEWRQLEKAINDLQYNTERRKKDRRAK